MQQALSFVSRPAAAIGSLVKELSALGPTEDCFGSCDLVSSGSVV
jgi:hypothetical protein